MSLTGIKTKPLLRGTVAVSGQWQALFAKANMRVYPYQLGALVRSDSTGTTVNTHGLGQFAQNNYVLPCRQVSYGGSSLYIPDTTRITRITSDPLTATDDQLTISPARALTALEFLLNLGNDTAGAPLSAPNYDGSLITLKTDNAGNNNNANKYLQTAQGGWFYGWTQDGYEAVDLLVTDSSGVPQWVLPFFPLGPSIV